MKCLNKQNEILLFLVTNGNLTLLFFNMGVNSIRADKFNYRPLVPRGLNKKEANISEQFLCLQQQFNIFNLWVSYDIRSQSEIFFKGIKE